MTEDTVSTQPAPRPARRRASRAAGPATPVNRVLEGTATTVQTSPPPLTVYKPRPAGPPPRRQPNRRLVALIALPAVVVLAAVVAVGVVVLFRGQQRAEAVQARDRAFVDTASQTVVNMFSYNQNNIDDSVNRFVNSTSGPLRDMLSQNNNVDNLKAIFRDTNASSEAVINGAALESVDEIARNGAVLVAVRVTVTDMQGTNKPSQPYRLRVIVHEDDNNHMTAYDLKYPDGGN